jgi:hypothetical protein
MLLMGRMIVRFWESQFMFVFRRLKVPFILLVLRELTLNCTRLMARRVVGSESTPEALG